MDGIVYVTIKNDKTGNKYAKTRIDDYGGIELFRESTARPSDEFVHRFISPRFFSPTCFSRSCKVSKPSVLILTADVYIIGILEVLIYIHALKFFEKF